MGTGKKLKNNALSKKEDIISPQELKGIVAAKEFYGPIPPPEIFRQYGEVVPDAPERILKVFEQDSQHVREMKKLALINESKKVCRAQWMAFVIMLAAIGLTAISIIYGKNIAPGVITGLATLFIALKVLFVGSKNNDSSISS